MRKLVALTEKGSAPPLEVWCCVQPARLDTTTGVAGSQYPIEGGFVCLFDPAYDKAFHKYAIEVLEKQRWLDLSTRAIFVELSVYNPNSRLWCIIRLTFETTPMGGVLPSSTFEVVKLESYAEDVVNLVLFVAFVPLVLFYTWGEIKEVRGRGCRKYFKSPWNFIELAVLFLFFLALTLQVSVWVAWEGYLVSDKDAATLAATQNSTANPLLAGTASSKPDAATAGDDASQGKKAELHEEQYLSSKKQEEEAEFVGFFSISRRQESVYWFFSFLALTTTVKLFKYIQFFPSVILFGDTLHRVVTVRSVGVVCALVIISFGYVWAAPIVLLIDVMPPSACKGRHLALAILFPTISLT